MQQFTILTYKVFENEFQNNYLICKTLTIPRNCNDCIMAPLRCPSNISSDSFRYFRWENNPCKFSLFHQFNYIPTYLLVLFQDISQFAYSDLHKPNWGKKYWCYFLDWTMSIWYKSTTPLQTNFFTVTLDTKIRYNDNLTVMKPSLKR